MGAILALDGLDKSYGPNKVTDDLDLHLDEGEAIGIVGPNGAGKTTMLNLISGQVRPESGRITFEGTDITTIPARSRCQLGIGRTYQVPRPFTGMTVFENVLVASSFGRPHAHENDAIAVAVGALEQSGLLPKANVVAGSLRLLDRKRLELARALGTQPRVLLLDEIGGGLTDDEVHALIATIKDLHRAGMSIIWIEHIVHALLSVVDRLVAINFGRKLIEGDPQAVITSKEVRDVYLGEETA
jgi:branched-chain amino acid transport system ATP-binding protein